MHSVRANIGGDHHSDHHSSSNVKGDWRSRRQTVELNRGAAYFYRTAAKELDEPPESIKSFRSIALALLVIAAICGMIALAIKIITPPTKEICLKPAFTIEHLFNDSFHPQRLRVQWRSELLYWIKNGEILMLDTQQHLSVNQSQAVLLAQELNLWNFEHFSVSADGQFVAVAIPGFKASADKTYILYDIRVKSTQWVSTSMKDRVGGGQNLQYFDWCPVNSCFIFVRQNNIYFASNVSALPVQLSRSGEEGVIFNGIADWLYEKEILGSLKAFWWSPSGSRLAALEINSTRVPIYTYPTYSTLYPQAARVRYPRAGDTRLGILPLVRVILYDVVQSCELGSIPTPSIFPESDAYLIGFEWLTESSVIVEWANRMQNKSYIFLCSARDNVCRTSISCTEIRIPDAREKGKWLDKSWVDVRKRRHFSLTEKKGASTVSFVTTAMREIHGDLLRSVAVVNLNANNDMGMPRFLTNREVPLHEVAEIVAVDKRNRLVYYTAPLYGDPKTRQLISVPLDIQDPAPIPRCLTCNLSPRCGYVIEVMFNDKLDKFVVTCDFGKVVKTVLCDVSGNFIMVLQGNEQLEDELTSLAMPLIERHVINRLSYKMEIKMRIPENMNHATYGRYPLLLYLKSDVETRSAILDSTIDWMSYLCASQEVIVATVDGRGTSDQGRNFAYEIYKNLGTVDVEDQLAALAYLVDLHYVDKTKIAVYGASYGGYVALKMLMAQSTVPLNVCCAVVISPITDWQLYDSTFAERYLGNKANSLAYETSSVLQTSVWTQVNHTRILLMHGTADESVHIDHSLRLIKVLNDANTQYSAHLYPDYAHKLGGENSQRHVTKRILDYMLHCFDNKSAINVDITSEKDKLR